MEESRTFSMDRTLRPARRGRYSETARSRPGHRAAGRHVLVPGRPRSLAIPGRGRADDLPERPAERAEADEPDVEADLRDAAIGLPQQEHRPLHPPPLEVAVRRLAERRLKRADEVRLADMGD